MTAAIFITFVAIMAAFIVVMIVRYRGRRDAISTAVALAIWFVYVGLMAHSGVLRDMTVRPPGIVLVVGPVILFLIVFVVQTIRHGRVALAFPLWLIISTQCFRVGVELFIHQLSMIGLAPKMLTFEGANVDIYIGATAPLIAWLATRGTIGSRIAVAWNGLGLLALANVVTRAILTAPGTLNLIHTDVPNRMLSVFPYVLIPAFFVPLAVVLHVVAISALSRGQLLAVTAR